MRRRVGEEANVLISFSFSFLMKDGLMSFNFDRKKKLLQYRICLIIYNLYNPALSFSTAKGISFAGILSYTEELNIWCQLWLLICRLKIFIPITLLAFTVLVPVHWTNSTLRKSRFTYSDVDKLSISNVPLGSQRLDTFLFFKCLIK